MQWVRANRKSKQGHPRQQQQWQVAPGKGSPSAGAPRAGVQPTKRPEMGTPCQPVPSVLRQWASQLGASSAQLSKYYCTTAQPYNSSKDILEGQT